MHARAANAYKNVDLESAPKHVVLERFFERFARDVAQARDAIVVHDIQRKANALDHALRIVGELTAALDHAMAPELCGNLAALYDYVSDRLATSNRTLELEPLDEAARLMAEIGSAFREVSR